MRTAKRLLVAFLALVVGISLGVFWQDIAPPDSLPRTVAAVVPVLLAFGAWKWSSRFK